MKKDPTTVVSMEASQLMSLFEMQLADIYWAEKAMTKAIPKMVKQASSQQLIEALNQHLVETEGQLERLAKVFASIGKSATAEKCDAMEGLIKEADDIMASSEAGSMRDAGIILAGQKIEHYEIASYGTLCNFAKILGNEEAAKLLLETLDEEKEADAKLSAIAESINVTAAETADSN